MTKKKKRTLKALALRKKGFSWEHSHFLAKHNDFEFIERMKSKDVHSLKL